MAKMNGCNDHMGGAVAGKSAGANRYAHAATERASMSKGGVNTDVGGGAKPYKPCLPAGKATVNPQAAKGKSAC